MQIYVNFLFMQKIIAIFASHFQPYAAKNTNSLDIFGDFRRNFFVLHRTRFFTFRRCPIRFYYYGSFGFIRIIKHFQLQKPQKTNSAESYQHYYKRFVARFIGVLATHFIRRN